MLKSLKSNSYRIVVVLLLLTTLLTFSVGGVIPVSALADPLPEFTQVYDTQIYQLEQSVEGLTDGQLGIFFLLVGAYVASQSGLSEYSLVSPYTTDDGVKGWLKSQGIKLYNDMLALAGGNIYDPLTGTNITPLLSAAVGYALGASSKAKTYTDETEFLNDVNTSDHYFVPYDPVLQASINAYFGRSYGLWNWQFDAKPFTTSISWKSTDLGSYQISYDSYYDTLENPIKGNPYDYTSGFGFYNVYFDIANKYDLFINTSNSRAYLVDSTGNIPSNTYVNMLTYYQNGGYRGVRYYQNLLLTFNSVNITSFSYSTIVDLVNQLLNPVSYSSSSKLLCYNNSTLSVPSGSDSSSRYPFFGNIINHVYSGLNWTTKQEVFNLTDFNYAQSDTQSYDQVPDNTLLDIKGLLSDLLNTTDLITVILNNLYDSNGVNITLPDIKVSLSLPDDNPLPVNLNEVALYLDNDYLDLVKQSATDYGNTIGQWFVFWHNSDPALLYTLLGSAIVILVGAFIGKWGHS